MADTKISLLTEITSPQDPTKMYVPLFAQDGTPLNARMNFVEIFKTPVQMNLNAVAANSAVIFSTPADGRLLLTDYAGTSFGRLQLGGTTNAYPSLKRNATGVDFRLADDSGYAPIAAGKTAISNSTIAGNGEILTLTTSFGTASLRVVTGGLFTVGGDIAAVGSASLISSSAHLKFGTGSDAGLLYVTTGVLQVTNGSSGLGALIASNVTTPPFAIVDGPSVDIDPANSGIQTWTIGDNRTPTAVNFASGQSMTLHLAKSNSAYNVTWSTIGVVWVGGSPPVIPNTGAAAIVLYKIGSTVYGTKFGDVA